MVMDLDPPMRLVPQPCVSPVRNVAVDVTTKSKNKTTWPAENKKIESSDSVEKAHGSPRKEDLIMEGISNTADSTSGRRQWKKLLWEFCIGGMWKNPPSTAHFDGLRGVACLTVLVWHFLCAYYPGIAFHNKAFVQDGAYSVKWGRSWLLFFFNGPFSVDIFYGLSGRVLLHSYMAHGKNSTLVSAMFRRILRLMVPFAVIVIFAWKEGQLGWVQYGVQAAVWTRSHWLPSPTLGATVGSLRWIDIKNFITLMFTESNLAYYIYNPRNLWTIRTEWRGSLAVFSLGFVMKNLQSRFRWVLYPILFRWFEAENGGALLAFVVGFFLCDVERNTPVVTYLTSSPTVLAQTLRVTIALVSAGIWIHVQSTLGFQAQVSLPPGDADALLNFRRWTALGTCGCLVFVQLTPLMRWLLATPPLRFVGYVSFCLYLVHGEVLNTFAAWLFLRLYQEGQGLGYVPSSLVVLATAFPVSLVLAWVMTVLVDDPSVRLARAVYQNFFCAFDEKLWVHRQLKAGEMKVRGWCSSMLASPTLGPLMHLFLFTEVPNLFRRPNSKKISLQETEIDLYTAREAHKL